jgi:hypothetical protein
VAAIAVAVIKPHSGDRFQPLAFLACPMPGEEFFFDRLDLQSEFHQLHDEGPKNYARQGRKIDGMRAFAEDSLDQCAHMPDALRDHDPKLRKMRPERIRQHRRCPISSARVRCSMTTAYWPALLTGTNRISAA